MKRTLPQALQCRFVCVPRGNPGEAGFSLLDLRPARAGDASTTAFSATTSTRPLRAPRPRRYEAVLGGLPRRPHREGSEHCGAHGRNATRDVLFEEYPPSSNILRHASPNVIGDDRCRFIELVVFHEYRSALPLATSKRRGRASDAMDRKPWKPIMELARKPTPNLTSPPSRTPIREQAATICTGSRLLS